jgi:hypothetical protein
MESWLASPSLKKTNYDHEISPNQAGSCLYHNCLRAFLNRKYRENDAGMA